MKTKDYHKLMLLNSNYKVYDVAFMRKHRGFSEKTYQFAAPPLPLSIGDIVFVEPNFGDIYAVGVIRGVLDKPKIDDNMDNAFNEYSFITGRMNSIDVIRTEANNELKKLSLDPCAKVSTTQQREALRMRLKLAVTTNDKPIDEVEAYHLIFDDGDDDLF